MDPIQTPTDPISPVTQEPAGQFQALAPIQTQSEIKGKKISKIMIASAIGLLILGGFLGVGVYMMFDGKAANEAAMKANIEANEARMKTAIEDNKAKNSIISDQQRKNDLSRLTTALTSYASNNRGSLPSANDESWDSFARAYLRNNGDTFADPLGSNYILRVDGKLNDNFDAANPVIIVTTNASCNDEQLELGQGDRKVAFQMRLEGGGIACSSN